MVKPRVQDLATLQDFFVKMGWVKQPVPIERVVHPTFLEKNYLNGGPRNGPQAPHFAKRSTGASLP